MTDKYSFNNSCLKLQQIILHFTVWETADSIQQDHWAPPVQVVLWLLPGVCLAFYSTYLCLFISFFLLLFPLHVCFKMLAALTRYIEELLPERGNGPAVLTNLWR